MLGTEDISSLTMAGGEEKDSTQNRLSTFGKLSGTPSGTGSNSGCSERKHQPKAAGGQRVPGDRPGFAGVPWAECVWQ